MPISSQRRPQRWLALLCICAGTAARAAFVAEQSPPHDSVGAAQYLPPSDFTLEHNPEVFGDLPTASVIGALTSSTEIDFYSFDVDGPTSMYADIDDTTPGNLDTLLSLFDSQGRLVGYGDDSDPPDPGSVSGANSFLGTLFLPDAGRYFIAVTGYLNLPIAFDQPLLTFNDVTRPDGAPGGSAMVDALPDTTFTGTPGPTGSYTLHITLVPEPASATLLLTGAAAAPLAMARKRIRRRTA